MNGLGFHRSGRRMRIPYGSTTSRTRERREENRRFTPVIVKRNDEARRHPDDILESAVLSGLEQFGRSSPSLLLSAVAAGLIPDQTPYLLRRV